MIGSNELVRELPTCLFVHHQSQVVSIHIGQAGIQIGSACWELLTLEQGITPAGNIDESRLDVCSAAIRDFSVGTFFDETVRNKYVPRAVLIDLEPSVIGMYKTDSTNFVKARIYRIPILKSGAHRGSTGASNTS